MDRDKYSETISCKVSDDTEFTRMLKERFAKESAKINKDTLLNPY